MLTKAVNISGVALKDSQEVPRLLWKPKPYYGPPLDPMLSQFNPAHRLTSYFLKKNQIMSLKSAPGLTDIWFPFL